MTCSTGPVAVLAPVVGPRIEYWRGPGGLVRLKNPTPKKRKKAVDGELKPL